MLTVSELSKVAQTTADAIRHYVRIGLLTATRDPDDGSGRESMPILLPLYWRGRKNSK